MRTFATHRQRGAFRGALPRARILSTEVTAAPTIEPITVQQFKDFMRIERSAEDALLETFITAARERIENRYGIAMIEQTVEARYAGQAARYDLPRAPAQATVSATTYDGDDIMSDLRLAGSFRHAAAIVKREAWGYSLSNFHAHGQDEVTITYTAGFLASDTATEQERRDAVPAVVKEALKMMVADFYEQRGTLNVGQGYSVIRLPEDVKTILHETGYKSYRA